VIRNADAPRSMLTHPTAVGGVCVADEIPPRDDFETA
jgi:hypothetical protein